MVVISATCLHDVLLRISFLITRKQSETEREKRRRLGAEVPNLRWVASHKCVARGSQLLSPTTIFYYTLITGRTVGLEVGRSLKTVGNPWTAE